MIKYYLLSCQSVVYQFNHEGKYGMPCDIGGLMPQDFGEEIMIQRKTCHGQSSVHRYTFQNEGRYNLRKGSLIYQPSENINL